MTIASRIVAQEQQHGPLTIMDVVVPDPSAHQVVVALESTGVCQSQVFWTRQPRSAPVLFGHEGYGRVQAVGRLVSGLSEGDHVLVTWLPRAAADGRAPEVATADLGGVVGRSPNVYTWAEHVVADELYVHRLSGPVDPEAAVAACAVITGSGSVLNAPVEVAGRSVVVIGAGGVGLCAVAAARIRGAASITVLDLVDDKLALADKFGATRTFNAREQTPEEILAAMGAGADLVVDCVANRSSVSSGTTLLRPGGLNSGPGGTLVLVGLPEGGFEVDLGPVVFGQRSIVGLLAGGCVQDDLDTFLDWHRRGELDLRELVTHRYPFDAVGEAVDDLVAGRVTGRAILTV